MKAYIKKLLMLPLALALIGISAVQAVDISVSTVPTIQAASYVAGYAVGALQTVSIFRAGQPYARLYNVLGLWKGTETAPLTFFIFDSNPAASTCTDKTAFVLGAADVPKLVLPAFTITAAAPTAGTGVTSTAAVSAFASFALQNNDTPKTTNIYVCAVATTTFTPAVGDLIEKFSVTN